jgi:hypothetical protein
MPSHYAKPGSQSAINWLPLQTTYCHTSSCRLSSPNSYPIHEVLWPLVRSTPIIAGHKRKPGNYASTPPLPSLCRLIMPRRWCGLKALVVMVLLSTGMLLCCGKLSKMFCGEEVGGFSAIIAPPERVPLRGIQRKINYRFAITL